MKFRSFALLFAAMLPLTACSMMIRSPGEYRDVTQKVLDSKQTEIRACYEDVLKTDGNAKGSVTLRLFVAEDTGVIGGATVRPGQTTAPDGVVQCVIKQVSGLKIAPPDKKKGDAIFTWDFTPIHSTSAAPAATDSAPAAPTASAPTT